jgi:hypothetical protein
MENKLNIETASRTSKRTIENIKMDLKRSSHQRYSENFDESASSKKREVIDLI